MHKLRKIDPRKHYKNCKHKVHIRKLTCVYTQLAHTTKVQKLIQHDMNEFRASGFSERSKLTRVPRGDR